MLPRVYLPDVEPGPDDIALPADQAHHLARVLRLAAGAEIRVFDGRGGEYRAEVTSVRRQTVGVRLLEPVEGAPLPRVSLTVVQSMLKADAMDGVVRDCTMVGVAAIQPVVSQRSTVRTALLAQARQRWERVALASARQCGRARLPGIGHAVSFAEWLKTVGPALALLLVEPAAAADAVRIRDLAHRPAPDAAFVIVGPEAGWAPAERELALQAGCTPLSLGRLTLRAEAVPLAATAALLAVWDD